MAVTSAAHPAEGLDARVTQVIVGVAADWDASRGTLQCFEHDSTGWRAVSPVIPVLYGAKGLAWGRGVLPVDERAPRKIEGDGRAPAGVFRIGRVLGYEPALPTGAEFPYHQVTAADAWIDDPDHPQYNRLVRVDPANPPPWFEAQRMRLGDPAYRWMIEIRHNADPPVPRAGSAIFFHIRRGPDRRTAGCTSMSEDDLLWIIRWLRAEKQPHYVLLPWAEYERSWQAWSLPPPSPELKPPNS